MRRTFAHLGIAALLLSGCTFGDEFASEEPTPATTIVDDGDTDTAALDDGTDDDADEPEADESPRPAATPTLPEGFEAPSGAGASDDESEAPEPTPSPTPKPTPSPTATSAGSGTSTSASAPPLGVPAGSSATASSDSPFQSLAQPESRRKNPDATASCQILAAEGENIVSCASGYVSSRGDLAFSVVVASGAGGTTTRLYSQQGSSDMVARRGAPGAAEQLGRTRWSAGDELVTAVMGGRRLVIGWDSGDAPKVVASFAAGADVDLVAGRIVHREGGVMRVYRPSVSGSSGTQVATSSQDRSPVDVALRVYARWIAGDYNGMQGLASPGVIDALRGAPNSQDLFVLEGTDCVRESANTARCTFDSRGERTVWRLQRKDGAIQVVDLK